jgi:hypothetical protein
MAIQGTTQFPVSHDTQTSPSMYALYKDTYIPVHNNLPVMDTTTSDIPLHQVNFAPNPATTPTTVPRGDDQSPHDSQIYSQDIVDYNCFIHPSIHEQHYHHIDHDTTHHCHHIHYQDTGCQVSLWLHLSKRPRNYLYHILILLSLPGHPLL